jgi:hypothetical protein
MGARVIEGAGIGFVFDVPKKKIPQAQDDQGGGLEQQSAMLVLIIRLKELVGQIIERITLIQALDNPAEVERVILEIERLDQEVQGLFGGNPYRVPVREAIRQGLGDFRKISQKCVDMELV